jgi:hypothetical protein
MTIPGFEPGPPRWEADNRLSYGAAYLLSYLRFWAFLNKLPIVQLLLELPSILRKPKVHYRVHKSPSQVFILSHIDPVLTFSSYLSKIYFFFCLGRLSKESD